MAEINKVIYGGNTLIDLTDATATANDILPGKTAYLANGMKVAGTANVVTGISLSDGVLTVTYSDGTSEGFNLLLGEYLFPHDFMYPHAR